MYFLSRIPGWAHEDVWLDLVDIGFRHHPAAVGRSISGGFLLDILEVVGACHMLVPVMALRAICRIQTNCHQAATSCGVQYACTS
jgi:hypothetical protein